MCNLSSSIRAVRLSVHSRVRGTGLERVTSGQLGEIPSNDFVGDRLDLALVRNACLADVQVLACLGLAIAGGVVRVVALVDGALERSQVPAVLEVTVPGVAGRVTVWKKGSDQTHVCRGVMRKRVNGPGGVDKGPLSVVGVPAAGKRVDVPGDFVEHLRDSQS
jgi:hypothetical protein